VTAGIYARISLDRQDGEGVARQLADCRALAAQRGWTDLAEYVDNDVSAYHGKRRPEYERLLADIAAGQLTTVIAYHPDRLYRHPRDLERFVDTVQAVGADVATVQAGDVDLSTPSGRMVARILGAVARQQVERIGELVSRAKKERAAQGRHSGGGRRPFGLTEKRTALVPEEANALREVAAGILAGGSWRSQVETLNANGVRNTSGQRWEIRTLRRVLTSPHIAGLRAYHGQIVGEATWPAILDRGTWELLRADTAGRRAGRPPSDKHLLTGLLACHHCGRKLYWYSHRRQAQYRCHLVETTTGKGCGRTSIVAGPTETYVADTVGAWLERPIFVAVLDAFLAYGDPAMGAAKAELDEIDRREILSAQQWASGVMGDDAHTAATAVLKARRAEIEARLAGAQRLAGGAGITAKDMAAGWAVLDIPGRREVIRLAANCPIPVAPGRTPDGHVVPVAERLAALRPVWE
jgi:DNA invertase Pin-like site-specific DNA recombinase